MGRSLAALQSSLIAGTSFNHTRDDPGSSIFKSRAAKMPKRWGLLKLIANLAILCWPATSPSNEAARGMAEPLRRGFRRRTDLGRVDDDPRT
jgi:hypothetical protein